MLKLIGAIAIAGGVGLGAAVYTGVLDFHADAKVTQKGEAKMQDLRNDAADFVRGVGNSAADATRGETPRQ